MKFKVNKGVDIGGTYLQRKISDVPYSRLVELFGPPGPGCGHKTDAEWVVEFEDGKVATIYNWKNGRAYCGLFAGLPVELITEWSIGGKSQDAADRVIALIRAKAEQPDTAAFTSDPDGQPPHRTGAAPDIHCASGKYSASAHLWENGDGWRLTLVHPQQGSRRQVDVDLTGDEIRQLILAVSFLDSDDDAPASRVRLHDTDEQACAGLISVHVESEVLGKSIEFETSLDTLRLFAAGWFRFRADAGILGGFH